MTENEYRQFVTELEFIGKDKKYSGLVNKFTKSLSFKPAPELLMDKRKAYDFTIANLFKKYHLVHEDLYENFDRLWDESISFSSSKQSKKPRKVRLITLPFPPGGFKLIKLQLMMDTYLKRTCEYCTIYAKERVDGDV